MDEDGVVTVPPSQYRQEDNLAARQRLWQTSRRTPSFSLYSWVVGLARLTGREAVLEVGCGNGAYLELIDAVGLDASPGMLHAARARVEGRWWAGMPGRCRSGTAVSTLSWPPTCCTTFPNCPWP